MQETGHKQFCQWHYCCSHDPRLADQYDVFEEFVLDLLQRNLCTVWTHYRTAYLWAAVTGTEPPAHEPTPCGNRGCGLAPVEVPEDFTPATAAAQVRRLLLLTGLDRAEAVLLQHGDGFTPPPSRSLNAPREEDANADW